MRNVLIIGIGAGHPDHLTIQAIEAMNRADVLLIPDKGDEKEQLRRVRADICGRFLRREDTRVVTFEALRRRTDIAGYAETVVEWHDRIAAQYASLLNTELADDGTAGFLVWGDPSLYDSTLRIIEAIQARGEIALAYDVVPGITSIQALAARHRIPLNGIGEPVHITTGRKLREGLPEEPASVVVMLDGEQAFARLDRDDLDVFWGANLGLDDEILVSGPLSDVKDEIVRLRAEAREAKGWLMDTYLLRKRVDR